MDHNTFYMNTHRNNKLVNEPHSHNYEWDPASAMRKLSSNVSISVNVGVAGISKQITGNYNPQTDAYRNCVCGHHKNFHK